MAPTGETETLPRDAIPEFALERSPARAVRDIGAGWLLVVLAALAAAAVGSVWAWLAAAAFIGVLQHRLLILVHHGLHYDFSESRRLNDGLARWLCAAPLASPLAGQRHFHFQHHRRFLAPDDCERPLYDLAIGGRTSRAALLRWLAACFATEGVRRFFGRYLAPGRPAPAEGSPGSGPKASPADLVSIGVVQVALFAGFAWLTGVWWAWAALWAAPALTVLQGINSLRNLLEHGDWRRPPHRLLSFRSSPLERFVLGPHNFHLHAEHHRAMRVPYYHLPAFRRQLEAAGNLGATRTVPSYLGHLRAMWRGLGEPGTVSGGAP